MTDQASPAQLAAEADLKTRLEKRECRMCHEDLPPLENYRYVGWSLTMQDGRGVGNNYLTLCDPCYGKVYGFIHSLRDREAASRQPHKLEMVGSTPTPATI